MNMFNIAIINLPYSVDLKDNIQADLTISEMKHKSQNRLRLFTINYELTLFKMYANQ